MSDPNYETVRSPKELYNAGTDEEHPLKALSRSESYELHPSRPDLMSPQFQVVDEPLGKWSVSDKPGNKPWDISRAVGRPESWARGDSYMQVDEHQDAGGGSTPVSRTTLYTDLQHFYPEHRFHVPTEPNQDVQGTMFSLSTPRKVGHIETHSVTTHPQYNLTFGDEDGPSDEELDAIERGHDSASDRNPDTAHSVGLATVRANFRGRKLSTYMLGQRQEALRKQGVEITADPFRSALGTVASFAASKRDPFARAAPVKGRKGKYLTSETSGDIAHLGDFDTIPGLEGGAKGLTAHVKTVLDEPGRAVQGWQARNTARADRAARRNAGEVERAKAFRASGHQGALFPGRLG